MDIGARLRGERERLGMTQEELGGIGGVLKRALIRYEKGERFPDAAFLAAIAAAGADVSYILTGQRSQAVESRLSERAKKLLDNYESASDDAKRLIEGTAKLAAHPPVPADGQAIKRKRA